MYFFSNRNFPHFIVKRVWFVSRASFYKKKLMNKSEYRVFSTIEHWVAKNPHLGYRLFSQVSVGEYMGANDDNAFMSINSKRVDFLIVNPFGEALVAVEYQGEGHYQNNAKDRDEVKAIAHDKAGIKLIEIFPRDDKVEILNKIDIALSIHRPDSNAGVAIS